jgi:POT family proton-dependent oligopeptide transporter
MNMLAALGLPFVAMTALAVVAVVNTEPTPPALVLLGRAGLAVVCLWYLLILAHSLLGKFELPEKFWQGALQRYSTAEISAARSVSPILFIFALVPVFWSLFDQSNSTWVVQGESMSKFKVLGFTIGAEQMQSANPLLVMILVPLLTLGVYPRAGKLATPLRRMSFGLFLTAASYVLVALLQKQIGEGAKISVAWQMLPYIVLTTGEVLVSTTGLEFAFTQAAPEMKSTIMSFWLLTVAFGNLLVTAITKLSSSSESGHAASVSTSRFMLYAGLTFIVAILFSLVASRYRYRGEAS